MLLKKIFIMPIHILTKKAIIAFISRLPCCCENLGSGLRLRGSSFGFSFRSLLFNPAVVINTKYMKQQWQEGPEHGGSLSWLDGE